MAHSLEKLTHKRIIKDLQNFKANPVEGINLAFNPDNMLEWYTIIEGSEETPFYGGFYLSKILLPRNYPFSVTMLTPNGRFQTNTNICYSYTNFHPESWSPALNPSHVALGLLSFMNDVNVKGFGCIDTTEENKKKLAINSVMFNLNCKIVHDLFPEVIVKMKEARNL